MKKCIVFILVSECVLGLLGCAKDEPLTFSHAVVCLDCGGYRNENAGFCRICVRNETIKEWLESKEKDEKIALQIENA